MINGTNLRTVSRMHCQSAQVLKISQKDFRLKMAFAAYALPESMSCLPPPIPASIARMERIVLASASPRRRDFFAQWVTSSARPRALPRKFHRRHDGYTKQGRDGVFRGKGSAAAHGVRHKIPSQQARLPSLNGKVERSRKTDLEEFYPSVDKERLRLQNYYDDLRLAKLKRCM